MALTSQDFSIPAGEAHTLEWTVYQADGTTPQDLTGYNDVTLTIKGRGITPIVWTETGGEITYADAANGRIDIAVDTVATALLSGSYGHKLEVEDGGGVVTLVASGVATFTFMQGTSYADRLDLIAYTKRDAWPDAERLLERAADLLDAVVIAGFSTDSSDLPTDPKVANALRDASCAQVEYWDEVGEEADQIGQTGTVSAGGSTYDAPRRLAPRARRHLLEANLLTQKAGTSPTGNAVASTFFGTESGQ